MPAERPHTPPVSEHSAANYTTRVLAQNLPQSPVLPAVSTAPQRHSTQRGPHLMHDAAPQQPTQPTPHARFLLPVLSRAVVQPRTCVHQPPTHVTRGESEVAGFGQHAQSESMSRKRYSRCTDESEHVPGRCVGKIALQGGHGSHAEDLRVCPCALLVPSSLRAPTIGRSKIKKQII